MGICFIYFQINNELKHYQDLSLQLTFDIDGVPFQWQWNLIRVSPYRSADLLSKQMIIPLILSNHIALQNVAADKLPNWEKVIWLSNFVLLLQTDSVQFKDHRYCGRPCKASFNAADKGCSLERAVVGNSLKGNCWNQWGFCFSADNGERGRG